MRQFIAVLILGGISYAGIFHKESLVSYFKELPDSAGTVPTQSEDQDDENYPSSDEETDFPEPSRKQIKNQSSFTIPIIGKSINYSNALSKLREYQVAQAVLVTENDRFSRTLSDLYKESEQAVSSELYRAWDGHDDPVPYKGYFFTDILENSDGSSLDTRIQCGLSAYPAKPGSSGDKIILILLDLRNLMINPDKPVSGAMHKIWDAPYDDIGGPVTRWPSENELNSSYRLLSRSIKQGTKEIKEKFDEAMEFKSQFGKEN